MPREFGKFLSTGTVINHYGSSGSIQIKTGIGTLSGIFCSVADNTPTLAVFNAVSDATGTIIATFTPVSATFYDLGESVRFSTGLLTKATGSVLYTVFYE